MNHESQYTSGRPWGRRRHRTDALITPNPKLRLLDQVREVLRLKHYSIRTERSYCDWIRRYVKFHKMRSRQDLGGGEAKMELFLSDLAVNGHVAASTQNQAFNALLFLYKQVLHQTLESVQAIRAERPVTVPTVLTVEEVKQVILAMSGLPQLVAKVLYGSGLRLMEALRLRVHDLDFQMKQITVRDGKGAKDRYTVLADAVIPALREHLEQVRLTHAEDLNAGGKGVSPRKVTFHSRLGWRSAAKAESLRPSFSRFFPGRRFRRLIGWVTRV